MSTLSARMALLARDLEAERGAESTRQHIVDAAVSEVEDCTDAGLSMIIRAPELSVETVAATGEIPREGDRLQYEYGEGPCLDTIWETPLVHSYDLAQESRWPRWAPRVVAELGVRSMLCVRLFTHRNDLGGLNLYSTVPGAFTAEQRDEALAVAAQAAIALAALREVDQMHHGLARRTVIGQATGMLMERYGLTQSAAFEVLRRVSQEQNRKVHDIAVELVESRHSEGL